MHKNVGCSVFYASSIDSSQWLSSLWWLGRDGELCSLDI